MNADTVMSHIGLGWLVIGYLLFVAVFYAYTWWHGHRVEDRTDGQVGFKVVIYTLLIMSLLLLTHGLQHGLAVAVSDEPIEGVRYGLPALLGGGVPALVLAFAFERRSNRDEFPRARRFALGALALIAGFLAALHYLGGSEFAGRSSPTTRYPPVPSWYKCTRAGGSRARGSVPTCTSTTKYRSSAGSVGSCTQAPTALRIVSRPRSPTVRALVPVQARAP